MKDLPDSSSLRLRKNPLFFVSKKARKNDFCFELVLRDGVLLPSRCSKLPSRTSVPSAPAIAARRTPAHRPLPTGKVNETVGEIDNGFGVHKHLEESIVIIVLRTH